MCECKSYKLLVINVLILVGTIICVPVGQARDLGNIGVIYPIEEIDLIDSIQGKLEEKRDSGELAILTKQWRSDTANKAKHPAGRIIPRAKAYRAVKIDPVIEISNHITDADGNILYHAGTRVNPLEYKPLTKTLCFFDGDDPVQIDWVESHCTDNVFNKMILVNGNIDELSQQKTRRYYFDQRGILVDKFSIQALPAVVRQSGLVLYVEEFPIN